MLEAAIITARGGSIRLPGKNVRPLGGVPLIAWTVRAALQSGVFKRVFVSTDDLEIARVAMEAGAEVPFQRPPELATSTASSADVIRHAVSTLRVSGPFAVLQPTSPFRNAAHLREASALLAQRSAPAVVSVTAAKPIEWLRQMTEDGELRAIGAVQGDATSRQEAMTVVCPNGAAYLTDTETFARTGALMPPGSIGYSMHPIPSIDIDTLGDFTLAEAIVSAQMCGIDP